MSYVVGLLFQSDKIINGDCICDNIGLVACDRDKKQYHLTHDRNSFFSSHRMGHGGMASQLCDVASSGSFCLALPLLLCVAFNCMIQDGSPPLCTAVTVVKEGEEGEG